MGRKTMDSMKIHLGSKWLGAVVALGVVFACVGGCHKTAASDASEAGMVGATAPDSDPDAAAEVAPPDPVVAGDPDIPLNEAVVGTAPVAPDFAADTAPPAAPVVEDQPPRPEPDDAWIPGYWWWSRPFGRYVWVSGAWRHPPPDQSWSPGAWNLVDGRYFWTPGYWGPHGYSREYIDVAPPPLRFETYGVAPGIGFVWTPGFYAYRGGSYAWTGGSWARPPSAGLGWIEPRYVTVGGRYTLQPGRWDFAPERRGVVYRPDINVRAGAHLSLAPVPQVTVSAHANFVAASAHIIARGGTRTPTGGFVVHSNTNVNVHANVQGGVEAHGAVVPGRENNEPHGGAIPTREEPHGGAAPEKNEVRPEAKGENEVHPGAGPKETPTHGAPVEEHHAAPVEEHHAAPVEEHHAAPVEEHHAAPVEEHHAAPVEEHHAAPAHTAAPVEHGGAPPAKGHPPEKKK
jgi:hypothetical protein